MRRLVLVWLLFFPALPAFAWGHLGHQIVGAFAQEAIQGTPAEHALDALLMPGESLASVATWADCVKGREVCKAPLSKEMEHFIHRFSHHKEFHYADVPSGLKAYGPGVGARSDDIVHVLREAIWTLQHTHRTTMGFTDREALFLLVHLLGDLHQPLHVGSLYLDRDGKSVLPRTEAEASEHSTQGGNLLCVGSRSLHSLWDDEGPQALSRRWHSDSAREIAHALAPPRQVRALTDPVASLEDWASQSVALANTVLRAPEHPARRAGRGRESCAKSQELGERWVWDVVFDSSDRARLQSVSAQQLKQAGERLAQVLVSIWP